MRIHISYDTVYTMFELCKKHLEGKLDKNELESLLDHEDYQVEMERYNTEAGPGGKFTKVEYIDYFTNLLTVDESDINSGMFRARYPKMKYFFENIDVYEEKMNLIKGITEDDIIKALERTKYGLPDEIIFEELNLIFSVGLGASEGWFYKNYAHFDIVAFLKEFNNIPSAIAHEVHHIGLNRMSNTLDMDKISVEEFLYLFLAFEGLAVKYCNNGEGILTQRIYNAPANVGIDKVTWNYLANDFENTYHNFKSQISMIRSGEIKNLNELDKYLNDYWMNRYIIHQDIKESPLLLHSRNYFLGNEVWGLIHDVYGREKVFYLLKNLNEFPEVYNNALKHIGRYDLCI